MKKKFLACLLPLVLMLSLLSTAVSAAPTIVYATFSDNHLGMHFAPIAVPSGSTITLPKVGTNGVYTFLYWLSSDNEMYPDGASFVITKDTLFVAQWMYGNPTQGGNILPVSGQGGVPTVTPPAAETYGADIVSVQNGSVTLSAQSAKEGDPVTITAKPDQGYKLDSVRVTDSKGGMVPVRGTSTGQYIFTMPDDNVSVRAFFAADGTASEASVSEAPVSSTVYSDVAAGAWYAGAVDYVTQNKIMSGVGDGQFAPDAPLSRAMIAQILYNLDQTAVSIDFTFDDIKPDAWYAGAVAWAYQSDIVSGVGGNRYAPNANITREQLATILYNYAKYKGKGFTGEWMFLLDYTDRENISDYAYEPLCWMTMNNVISGMEDGTLNPQGTAARAQVASILMNFTKALSE